MNQYSIIKKYNESILSVFVYRSDISRIADMLKEMNKEDDPQFNDWAEDIIKEVLSIVVVELD